MQTQRNEIKSWLKKNDLSYEWLAQKCFVTYNTVRNWMGKQPIPNAKLALIQQLMSETSSTESDIITITIPAEFEERVRAEAAKLHLAIDEFVMKTLADKAAMAAKFSKTTQDALAAHEASMAAAGVAPEDETPEEMKQRLTDSLPKFNAVKKQEKQKKNNHKSA